MIERALLKQIQNQLFKRKVIIIIGPRQSGKTTLLYIVKDKYTNETLYLNCDEPNVRNRLLNASSKELKNLIGKSKLILLDEVQRVKNIGLTLKLMADQIPDIQIIATGSSAFELTNEINEPLTGRKFEYILLPISTSEMIEKTNNFEEESHINLRLIYGMYPDVINNPGEEQAILNNLAGSYLYKDIFAFQDLRRPEILERLLESLALQMGSEVSYNELAKSVGVDQLTIQRYIVLLEKTFVVFRLRSFSRNRRNELKKSRKIYFYDNGIRNAIIGNFSPIDLRNDIGYLWENFLISERLKVHYNSGNSVKKYFWRTIQQQEIDYIEEFNNMLYAYEFKWNPLRDFKFSTSFVNSYPNCKMKVITKENYLNFLATQEI